MWIHKEKPDPEWKRWYAWHPVPIKTYPIVGGDIMVFLQWIERKWVDCREGSNRYEYRLTPGQTFSIPLIARSCKNCGIGIKLHNVFVQTSKQKNASINHMQRIKINCLNCNNTKLTRWVPEDEDPTLVTCCICNSEVGCNHVNP
jgi:hypothetical protein